MGVLAGLRMLPPDDNRGGSNFFQTMMKWKSPKPKTWQQAQGSRRPFSARLKRGREAIAAGRHEEGLKELNNLAATDKGPLAKGKILHVIADSQFSLRRLDEAETTYKAASQLLRQGGSPKWFGATLGATRCCLETQKIEDSLLLANDGIKMVLENDAHWSALEKMGPQELQQQGVVIFPPRPVRPQVALTRVGQLFLQAGYTDTAEDFFKQAILRSPNGASRAKQSMARIRLATQNYEEAERYARESLICGRFQAKTLPGWELYFNARSGRNLPVFDADLHAQMLHNASSSVKSRAMLSIACCLRKHDDSAWRKVVADYLAWPKMHREPAIEFELKKIQLADAQLNPSMWELDISRSSVAMLRNPSLSHIESIAIAKTFAKSSCEQNTKFTAQSCTAELRRLRTHFNQGTHDRAIHSAALGAMLARRQDIARQLLEDQIRKLPKDSHQRRKDAWALAKMEAVLGERGKAADLLLGIAAEPSTPPRFKIMAFSHGLRQLRKAGTEIDIQKIERSLRNIIAPMDDYSLLLDTARQLYLHGDMLRPLAKEVSTKAVEKALAAAESSEDATEVIRILNHLARRQYFEFGQGHEISEYWENLTPARRELLWSASASYWEYMLLIVKSYFCAEQPAKAKRFAESLLAQPNTPPTGFAIIACALAEHHLAHGRTQKAMDYFAQAVQAAPSARCNAIAYYWQSIYQASSGSNDNAAKSALQARKAIGRKPSLGDEWMIDAKAHLLLKRILPAEPSDASRYTDEFLGRMAMALDRDMTHIRP